MQDLKISVAEILGRPGAYRDHRLQRPLEGVGTALARLDEGGIEIDLRLESVVEGILATGTATAGAVVQCARCLKEISTTVSTELCEMFYAPGHEPPSDEEAYQVRDSEVDLEPMLRDELTLGLPLNPLCDEACKGICARCGRDLNVQDCVCEGDETDPRWAALDALRDKLANS